MLHICTNESLVAGGHEMTWECPVCFVFCMQTIGYVGALCSNCNNLVGDNWMGDIAYMRRKYLGLSRAEVGKLTGVFAATIGTYETSRCSKKYLDKLKKLIKEKNNLKGSVQSTAMGSVMQANNGNLLTGQ